MDSKMLFILNRLSKMQRISPMSQTLIRYINLRSRSYNTITRNKDFYCKISTLINPGVNPTAELDDWVQKGNKVRVDELREIIRDLRRWRIDSQSLEVSDQVSEWMIKKGFCLFTPAEQLDLVGDFHGFVAAETFFKNLPNQHKTEKTYGVLLHCYIRQCQAEKSLTLLQEMKDKGFTFSPSAYNDIMWLYTNDGEYEKVRDTLTLMKKHGFSPNNLSYRFCINSYGVKSDINGMESILKEMVSQPQIVMDSNTYSLVANFYIKSDLKDKAYVALMLAEAWMDYRKGDYNHLISLHGCLGNTDNIFRLWGMKINHCSNWLNEDYIVFIESLVKLGEFKEAEKLFQQWKMSPLYGESKDFRVPYALVTGYVENRNYKKAERFLEALEGENRFATQQSWSRVAEAYLKKGKMGKVINCIETAIFSLGPWKPNRKVVISILSFLGKKGSVKELEDFEFALVYCGAMCKEVYYAKLKAYIREGKEVCRVLQQMKVDNIDEDEETRKILSMKPGKIRKDLKRVKS